MRRKISCAIILRPTPFTSRRREEWRLEKSESGQLRRGGQYHEGKHRPYHDYLGLERNALSPEQRQRAPGVSRHLRVARVFAISTPIFPRRCSRPFAPSCNTVGRCPGLVSSSRLMADAAWDRLLSTGDHRERRAAIGLVFTMNFLTHLFLALGEGDRVSPIVGRLDAERDLFSHRPLFAPLARDQSRDAQL